MPQTKATPPKRFMTRARTALAVASSPPSWPMRAKEQSVVSSQKK